MPELMNMSSSAPAANAHERYQDDVSSVYEMDDNAQSQPTGAGAGSTAQTSPSDHDNVPKAMRGLGIARHTLGLILLLLVVFLWTTSNFLGSVSGPVLTSPCGLETPLLTSFAVDICGRHLCQTFLLDLSQRVVFHACHGCAHDPRCVVPTA